MELAAEVQKIEETKKDFLVPTPRMRMSDEANVIEIDEAGEFKPNENFHEQLSERLGIPRKYYRTMQEEAPSLLSVNVNHWLQETKETRMVRTLDGTARAFLSDKFRPLDNFDLMHAILPDLQPAGLRVESCQLTETRLYLKVVSPRVEMEVRKGDIVQAGLVISNSEIGAGALSVEPMVYRLVCLNGMIGGSSFKKYHVGRAGGDIGQAVEFWRDETRAADDKALWMKVRDVVRGALSDEGFQSVVATLKWSTEVEAKAGPTQVIEVTKKRLGWTDAEGEGVLTDYCKAGDFSLYGLVQAVTRYSQDVESYDRATELERQGGQLLSLNQKELEDTGFVKRLPAPARELMNGSGLYSN